jgi:hypothetical protein
MASDPRTTDSCVAAIRNAFGNGLQVFKKLRKRGKKTSPPSEDEIRLVQSLKKSPVQISDEYYKNRALQGHPYEQGDRKLFLQQFHNDNGHTLTTALQLGSTLGWRRRCSS